MTAFLEVWRNAYVRLGIYALSIFVLYRLAGELSSVLTLAGLAYLFAYLFHPLVTWVEARRVPRSLGLAFVFLIVIVFLAAATLLTGSVINQLIEFSAQLPTLVANTQKQVNTWLDELEQVRGTSPQLKSLIDQATNAVQDGLSSIVTNLLNILRGTGLNIISRTIGVLGGVIQFFLVLVIGTYMLGSFTQIGQSLLELFPKRSQPKMLEFSKDVSIAVGGYIRGQLVIAAGVGTMVGVGLAILGVPLALGLGFLSAVFNVVPYLGVVISIAPAILLAAQFGIVKVLLVLLVFMIANQVEAQFLSPNILAKTTDLHPITVIITILAGASLLGVFGGLLAVPLVALGKLLIRKHWIGSRYHTGPVEPVTEPAVTEPAVTELAVTEPAVTEPAK